MILNNFKYEKESDWKCEVFGVIVIRPTENNVPNWFRRKIQEVLLGVKWSKAKTPPKQVAILK